MQLITEEFHLLSDQFATAKYTFSSALGGRGAAFCSYV